MSTAVGKDCSEGSDGPAVLSQGVPVVLIKVLMINLRESRQRQPGRERGDLGPLCESCQRYHSVSDRGIGVA